ncbi:MAG: hypothetical protein Fur0018_13140 [Anaerolineales bacterium]
MTFQVIYHHADGAMPPPHHAEWTLTLEHSGRGCLQFCPDYPGRDAPLWQLAFTVDDLTPLEAALPPAFAASQPALRDDFPVGGSTCQVACTFGGESRSLYAGPESMRPPAVRTLCDALRALVPQTVWDEAARRREAYHAGLDF